MQVIEPPHVLPVAGYSIFLAGSIEMGKAEEWQQRVIQELSCLPDTFTIMNPRRKVWDSSWTQEIRNPDFKEQVEWELKGLELADFVVFYFDPFTTSPITLLELGLMARTRKRIYVYCPHPFWKKGNVDVVCDRYGIQQYESLSDLTEAIRRDIL